MKRLIFLLTLIMGLSCVNLYAQKTKEEKEQEEATKALLIKEIVQNKKYIIYCDRVYPQHGPSRVVGREYTLEMKGDKFRSYLPYNLTGARATAYDGLNILDFEEEYTDYECKEGKKGRMLVSFRVKNGMETLEYSLTIQPTGIVNIHILPLRRDPISFSGELGINRKMK